MELTQDNDELGQFLFLHDPPVADASLQILFHYHTAIVLVFDVKINHAFFAQ